MGTVNLNENNMMFGFNKGTKHELLLNTFIFISKWSIWKARNKDKYDKIHINQNVLCNIWNKGNNKITELRTILQRESQNS